MSTKFKSILSLAFFTLALGMICLTIYVVLYGSSECPQGYGTNPICIPIAFAERIAPGEGVPTLILIFLLLTTLFFHIAFTASKKDPR